MYCYKHKVHKFLTLLRTGALPSSLLTHPLTKIPQWVTDILISKFSFWVPGFAAGLSLFVEEKRRRGELAMYVLPKGLESVWVMARGKGLVFRTGKWGETMLTALGMAMVMVRDFRASTTIVVRPTYTLEHIPKRPTTPVGACQKDFVSVYWA